MIIGYEALPAGIPTARILAGSGAFASGEELIASSSQQTYAHFAPHCATARRLVSRAKERGVMQCSNSARLSKNATQFGMCCGSLQLTGRKKIQLVNKLFRHVLGRK